MIGDKKSISSSTVQKVLFKKGLRSYVARKKPYLSYAMKKKRVAWCKQYKNMDSSFWRNVVFSDETYIEINMKKTMNRVRRFSSENRNSPRYTCPTIKHPLKVLIWSCFPQKKFEEKSYNCWEYEWSKIYRDS